MGRTAKIILIINFDAHCDTRVDDRSHSGTPFRDFDGVAKKPFHLIQIGIHEYANNDMTLSRTIAQCANDLVQGNWL